MTYRHRLLPIRPIALGVNTLQLGHMPFLMETDIANHVHRCHTTMFLARTQVILNFAENSSLPCTLCHLQFPKKIILTRHKAQCERRRQLHSIPDNAVIQWTLADAELPAEWVAESPVICRHKFGVE